MLSELQVSYTYQQCVCTLLNEMSSCKMVCVVSCLCNIKGNVYNIVCVCTNNLCKRDSGEGKWIWVQACGGRVGGCARPSTLRLAAAPTPCFLRDAACPPPSAPNLCLASLLCSRPSGSPAQPWQSPLPTLTCPPSLPATLG